MTFGTTCAIWYRSVQPRFFNRKNHSNFALKPGQNSGSLRRHF